MKKNKFIFILFLSALNVFNLSSKEIMDKNSIITYLNKENPYIYTIIANKEIQNAKITYANGEFDTKIGTKYDKKDYPLSNSSFNDIYIDKPFENGTELLLSYRTSTGTQEYNNIKTGKNGEALIGVKIPVIPFINGINQNKLNLEINKIDFKQTTFSVNKNLRELYTTVFSTYYQFLYRNELVLLEKELLENAKKRNSYINKKVLVGDTAPIILTESLQLINEREQRLEETKNNLNNVGQQLSIFLNISKKEMEELYELPLMEEPLKENIEIDLELKKAIEERLDIKIFDLENNKINEQNRFNENSKYPEIDFSINGVHDNYYNEDGIKFSINMNFPIERNKYYGKQTELLIKKNKNNNETKKSLLEIQKNMIQLINTLNTLRKNYGSVLNEINLAEQVERAAKKQFELGQENLFIVNQRELKTLQVKIKKSEYKFKILLVLLEIEKETGKLDIFFNKI